MASIVTIGVYGFTGRSFIERLMSADVRWVLDVRQRRGVRGAEYAWANARRLQASLAAAGIAYAHRRDLAPTTELRQLQYAEDDRLGVGKRSRRQLAPGYMRRYEAEILDAVDLGPLVTALPPNGAAALLCVETEAQACHRSLVAHRLAERYPVDLRHLGPP